MHSNSTNNESDEEERVLELLSSIRVYELGSSSSGNMTTFDQYLPLVIILVTDVAMCIVQDYLIEGQRYYCGVYCMLLLQRKKLPI